MSTIETIIVFISIYTALGFFIGVICFPSTPIYGEKERGYDEKKDKAISKGIFWMAYLLIFLYKTLVRSFMLLIKS